MDHYRANLDHVVRPENPDERDEPYAMVDDWAALLLRRHLTEFAAYAAPSPDAEAVALAYAEYIDMAVRDEGKRQVKLFAHTDKAERVLDDASDYGEPTVTL
jgi:hypothetical protein